METFFFLYVCRRSLPVVWTYLHLHVVAVSFFSCPIAQGVLGCVFRPMCGSVSEAFLRIVCLLCTPPAWGCFQGAGTRRWSIENTLTSGEEEEKRSVQDIDLRVLADFKEAQVRRFSFCCWIFSEAIAMHSTGTIHVRGDTLIVPDVYICSRLDGEQFLRAIDLFGWSLSDTQIVQSKWQFPWRGACFSRMCSAHFRDTYAG